MPKATIRTIAFKTISGGGEGGGEMIGGHPSWETLLDFIDKIGSKHGGIIHDNRCGKTWDPGQAICAELYGENWETSEKFNEDNQIPVDQPCPTGALEAAQRVLNGTPWMEEGK